ncbi:hypothetical protein [Streptomyces bambusae]|uniref:Uncharacterized protein n=1 Tax=Streptomyces bambusae TaxID=1550616 RepID=A0ABS6Z8L5_9ACTN|nr:hypothetical protein [Streptomyces bambusae]MBW5484099.1 hypothetical protein [Streptomyces bambusae]
MRRLEEAVKEGRNTSGFGCLTLLIGVIAYGVSRYSLRAALIGMACFLVLLYVSSPRARLRGARRRLAAARRRAGQKHERRVEAWTAELAAHRQAHLLRNEHVDTWYPLALDSGPSRIDVFGGTGNGWASLLATLGGSLLGSGRSVVVLDLTQQAVALELAGLAGQCGIPVGHVSLPGALLGLDLREEFTPEELAEALAEALGTLRPPGADVDLHTIDVDLVQTVAGLLPGPLTFARLAAGLRVLLGLDAAPLAPAEAEAVAPAADRVGRSERVQDELRYVRAQIELLARAEPADLPDAWAADWWQPGRLTVLGTEDLVHRRKDLADRFVFFRLIHVLRRRAVPQGGATLVVAGADHLGRAALELMARHARAAGVRLVLLMEHLREAALEVAGGSDSATVFMRLGNGEEARAAAQFIGREHRFLVSRLTRQLGETFTEGRASSYTDREDVSESAGTATGGHRPGPGPARATHSVSTSLSRSWQESAHTSTARSTSDAETQTRAYEFAVEPTQLQALPPTGLVLVESGPRGRRVAFADCNPGIGLQPRRSAMPRT